MTSPIRLTISTIAFATLLGLFASWSLGGGAQPGKENESPEPTDWRRADELTDEVRSATTKERRDSKQNENALKDREPGDSIRASDKERKILKELDQPTKVHALELEEVSLRDVLEQLAEVHNIDMFIDNLRIDEADSSIDVNVSIEPDDVRDLSLHEFLRLLLDPSGLAFDIQNDVLRITTRDYMHIMVATRAYAIPDTNDLAEREQLANHLTELMAGKYTFRAAQAEHRRLELVSAGEQETTEQDPPQVIMPSPLIKVFADRLIMTATVADHHEIQELLRMIYMGR